MTFSLAPHVSTTETETGMVLLDERSGRYWQMNETGALVLRNLLEGGTPESAVIALRARFPTVTDDLGEDVAMLVAALRGAGVVTP
ncbi:lasso peptide biosynthesis PqqD family chaperone [Embleya sp. NPDC050493]|uniref:lasso peptide biosynthesis PqqD family chaperone n=1 Tax=Embleya sp. NPDC050493 TaxID=3363989 RepID=UPI0037BA7BFD